jgi:hypothetical protein
VVKVDTSVVKVDTNREAITPSETISGYSTAMFYGGQFRPAIAQPSNVIPEVTRGQALQ